jgi:glycosyltransferase involved in cell wall biosynthesis
MSSSVPAEIKVSLLTGGFDRPYVYGIAMALAAKEICVDIIGSDDVDRPELHAPPALNFLNLRGNQERQAGFLQKVIRVLTYYARLVRYALSAKPKIFHILWNNKFLVFDRTLLMLFYKLIGKKVVFTAHNVNAGKRDGNNSLRNRLSLKIQYRLSDHIFVHTPKMKEELLDEFGVRTNAVTVIPFGINNSITDTGLTPAEAKRRLGIKSGEKTILFFGIIRPYKGLEHLIAAFQQVAPLDERYRLIVAGEVDKESTQYMMDIQQTIEKDPTRNQIMQRIEYVPDSETELYFKAADVLVLPYTRVFQSGVLFLSYSFGLPVIASDVASFREDINEGDTGFLCAPCDSADLAKALETYFKSELYRDLDRRRQDIRNYANARNSWNVVGDSTRKVYSELLEMKRS